MVNNVGYLRPFYDGTGFLYGVGDLPRTLAELAMMYFSAELRSIPEWWKVYHTEDFRRKWFQYALTREWEVGPRINERKYILSEKQIEYVLDELSGYAALRNDATGAEVSCFERIWESERLFTANEHISIAEALDVLRAKLRRPKQQLPNHILLDPYRRGFVADRTVTDHPYSLDPLDGTAPPYCISKKYAALPTDAFVYDDVTPNIKFLSYINGVDTSLVSAYRALRLVLSRHIHLFENVLTELHRQNPLPQRIKGGYGYNEWDEPEPPTDSDDDDAWEDFRVKLDEWARTRPIVIPDIRPCGYTGDLQKRAYQVSLRGRNIQVIYKISDFDISPNGDCVPEEPWHVEGMMNESIVVCAAHCVTLDNIEPAHVEFRMAVTSPAMHFEGDYGATVRTWGVDNGDDGNQYLGSVPLREGLSLAFPNIYQHHLSQISPADPTKPSRLTIIWTYLVDPDAPPILSTSRVAPQDPDLVYHALEERLGKRLPPELIYKIVSELEGVIGDAEADRLQMEMHAERDVFRLLNDRNYFCLPFDAIED